MNPEVSQVRRAEVAPDRRVRVRAAAVTRPRTVIDIGLRDRRRERTRCLSRGSDVRIFRRGPPVRYTVIRHTSSRHYACAVNQPGYGGFIWTHSDGLTWLRLITADALTWPRPRAAASSAAAAWERGESVRAGRVVLSEIHARRRLPGVAGAAGKSGAAGTWPWPTIGRWVPR